MYKKNELKNLIYIQENKPCNEQTVNGLFRSIVEPILEKDVESLVLCRLEDNSKKTFASLLKRLGYSNANIYDFSNTPINEIISGDNFVNVLKENIWDKTEFLYVLAERFGAVLMFDYDESGINGLAQVYTLYNSKNLSDVFEIINKNSKIDLSELHNKTHPDRRDNELLNNSIRKIIENLNDTNQEMLISELTKETSNEDTDLASRLEFLISKSSYVTHEMRNLLSICNLYSTIIEKQGDKVYFADEKTRESVLNARDCIRKSMKMTNNLLLDFKSMNNVDLRSYNLFKVINSGLELARIYANGKNITFTTELEQNADVLIDENKFLSVLINLIKNAIESIDEETSGEILLKTKMEDETIKITISNNGNPINKELQEKIFEEGVTTKKTGCGLGLAICKKTLEEQFAQLKLKKSDEASTEFEITILKG